MRLTVKDVARQSGLCVTTVRKHADSGRIPYRRDLNGWRVFNEQSIDIAKILAGTADQK